MSAWAAVAQAAVKIGGEYYSHRGNRRNMKTGINMQQRFSERMSNTQYQRGVEDMKAAGINPMVAYSQGGAGTPGAGSQSASGGGDFGEASSAYQAGQRLENETKVTKETIDKIKADTRLTNAEAKQVEFSGPGITGRAANTAFQLFEQFQNWLKKSKTTIKPGSRLPDHPSGRPGKIHRTKKGKVAPGQAKRDINQFSGKSGKQYKGEKGLFQK